MNEVHIESKILLRSMIGKLVANLEIANKIPDEDFINIVHATQKREKILKNVRDNVERGNLILILFWVTELIEDLVMNNPLCRGIVYNQLES
jgi:hypothetical protein